MKEVSPFSGYSLSYWERQAYFDTFDFLIIGGGIVGLSAALFLKERHAGARVAVVERGVLPIGASTRNAGFACFGSMTELLEDLPRMGGDALWALVEKRWKGLQQLRRRVGDRRLAFATYGGYELFRQGEEDLFGACLAKRQAFNQMLGEITGRKEVFRVADEQIAGFGFRGVAHLLLSTVEGQLHPGWMMAALWEEARHLGVAIYPGLSITDLEEEERQVTLKLSTGWSVNARRVLVATNGFAARLLPELPVQPARNQVLVTHPVTNLPFRGVFHYDRGFYYFRNIDGRLLLGGGRNLSPHEEQTSELGTTPQIRQALLKLLREVILPGQQIEVDYWWSGILGIGEEKSPIVKKISPRVAVAVRLGGMGVAIGSLVGEEGARLLEGV